jgi:pimeloyl-ACP methyl ester carboxylesterase
VVVAGGGVSAAGRVAAIHTHIDASLGRLGSWLKRIRQPTLVVNGVYDEMIPVANSYGLSGLPSGMLIAYPVSGHGALFQFNKLFTRQVTDFLPLHLMHAH